MPQDTRLKVYWDNAKTTGDGWIVECQFPFPGCDWYLAGEPSSEAAWEAGEEHWEYMHPQPEDEPEDVARTELDWGLKDLDNLDQISTKNELKPVLQQDAQLHLLASIATSLYEIRTAGLRALELLTTPQVMVQSPEQAAREEYEELRRAMELAKARSAEEGRKLASERDDLIAQGVDPKKLGIPLGPFDDIRKDDLMCKQCPHAVKSHDDDGCTVILLPPKEQCDCKEPGFETGPPNPKDLA